MDEVRAGSIVVDGLHVAAADTRGRALRPHGWGVDVLQGAFTLWNRQPRASLTATLSRISAGSERRPVHGSGVLVGGSGDRGGHPGGGEVRVSRLTTGEIDTEGGIAPGTRNLISGGVFVAHSAIVEDIVNEGPITTDGQNGTILGNWGSVERWTVKAPLVSHGPSGTGFVQYGELGTLNVEAPIKTFGIGAHGFDGYDGSLGAARFAAITTHGGGGVGIQIGRKVGRITVDGDVKTTSGIGVSLVEGNVVPMPAYAVSVQPDGDLEELSIRGSLITEGADLSTLHVRGVIHRLEVSGSIVARGERSQPVAIDGGTVDPLRHTSTM